MTEFPQYEEALINVRAEVSLRANSAEDGNLLSEAFTEWAMDLLHEHGELEEGDLCNFFVNRVGRINAYRLDLDSSQLYLYVSEYSASQDITKIYVSDIEGLANGALRLLKKGQDNWRKGLEESSPGFDFCESISSVELSAFRIRVIILSNCLCPTPQSLDSIEIGEKVSVAVWDLVRLSRVLTSGNKREPISIDFKKEAFGGKPIAFMRSPSEYETYQTFLGIVPGPTLAAIYREYGPRILELNVRSYLQARGKVNKGIRKTIIEEPDMFLAYNNGICATADKVQIEYESDNIVIINSLTDFQIVNGGQTTASLASVLQKDKADLSKVLVQVKLSVIKMRDKLNEVVANIARFANSQNKISDADLTANDNYHTKLEELSRTTWVSNSQGSGSQTKWYYERARGQYADEKSRRRTPAQIRVFELEFPPKQWFTKTDLAKFENTWDQLPHIVSRGAQKNFTEFMLRLAEQRQLIPDQRYYELVVAKAILFRETERIVGKKQFGGYRANIVTFTLAWLLFRTAKGIDLSNIWKSQALGEDLANVISEVCHSIHAYLTDSGGTNVTEYCKREGTWTGLKSASFELSVKTNEFLNQSKQSQAIKPLDSEALTGKDLDLVASISNLGKDAWMGLARWAKETNSLQGWQRSIAFSVGKAIAMKGCPSIKQAVQAEKILVEARKLGFDPDKVVGSPSV